MSSSTGIWFQFLKGTSMGGSEVVCPRTCPRVRNLWGWGRELLSGFERMKTGLNWKGRRLSVIADSLTLMPNENFHHARLAFFFGKADFSSFIALFKLLRVLDMERAPLESFPEVILGLHLLRYLSLQDTRIQSIPRSIKRLSLLETLDLKETPITQPPDTISRPHRLRHLLVYHYEFNNYVTFEGGERIRN